MLGQCYQAEGQFRKAAEHYAQAIAGKPQGLTVYKRYGYLLRQELSDPQRADQIMDQLVAANSQSPQASLERARYRRTFGLQNAAEDMARC